MTRSRPAIHEAPAPNVESGTEVPSLGAGTVRPAERLTLLVAEARSARGPQRTGLAGAINGVMALLPLEADPQASAALLHRLQEEGLLEGLEDEAGLPCGIAATRALLELGYPHALEVSPERLAALRGWSPPSLEVPWVAFSLVLFFAFIVQVGFITLGAPGLRTFGASADALAGVGLPPERTWVDTVEPALHSSAMSVFGAQVLGNFLAFLAAVTVGGRPWGRPWARRFFLGIAGLGLLVGTVQLLASGWMTASTFVSAAGSLACAWLLKEQ